MENLYRMSIKLESELKTVKSLSQVHYKQITVMEFGLYTTRH